MVKARVDISGLKEQLKRIRTSRSGARKLAAAVIANDIVTKLIQTAPRDTNRYVRGWAMAGRGAGVAVAVPEVKDSSRRALYLERLGKELSKAKKRAAGLTSTLQRWYLDNPKRKKSGYYTQLKRDVAKADKLVLKLEDQLKRATKATGFLLFDARRGRRNFSTIRDKIYGGEGSIRDVGDRSVVTLHNLEAHARILEWKGHYLAQAEAAAKMAGFRRAGKKYLSTLQAAAGKA